MKRWLLLLVLVLVGLASISVLGQEVQIPLPKGAIARLGREENGYVTCSSDGRYIAVATKPGIELRNAKTLNFVRFITGYTHHVLSVAFCSDAKIPASNLDNGTIKICTIISILEG